MSRALPAALLALVLSACASSLRPMDVRRPPAADPIGPDPVVLPFTDAGGILLLPALVDGRGPYHLALDTGATTVVLGENVAAEARLATEERAATVVTELGEKLRVVEQCRVREIRVGPVRYARLGALVADLSGLSRQIGRPLDGILGMPVLRHHTWTVDLDRGVVVVSEERVPEPDGRDVLALDLSSELPEITLEIGGRSVRAILDTGQKSALTLSPEDARPFAGFLDVVGRSTGYVLDGRVDRAVARLRAEVRAGSLVLEQPLVILGSGTRMGLDAFAGRTFTLDLQRGRLWLR